MEIKTFTSTLAMCALLTSTSVYAGKEGGEDEKKQTGPIIKAKVVNANDQIRVGSVILTHTGKPQKVEENDGKVTVTTDNNAVASYQLVSGRRTVIIGEEIEIPYTISVEDGGKISLGLLNSKRNGWYPSQNKSESSELILGPGVHAGVYKRFVPEGETETSLVLRNYHLVSNGGAGQSTFTIENLGFNTRITPIFPNETVAFDAIALRHTGNPEKVEKKEGVVTVTTDNNNSASYQLRSDWVSVKPKDSLEVAYKVTLKPHSKVSFGFLNTKGTGWYPLLGEKAELLFTTEGEEKTFEGTFQRPVPLGEEKTAFVVRNYHLDSAGQSGFTIEKLGFKKTSPVITTPSLPKETALTSSQLDKTGIVTDSGEGNPLLQSLIEHPKEANILQSVSSDQKELSEEQQKALAKITENTDLAKGTPWTIGDYLTLGLARWWK